MSRTFAVGDRVTWKSQAAGSWKQKTGTVVEVVPAFKIPKDKRFGSSRKVQSYIVEVTYEPKQSRSPIKAVRTKKPERYWPVVGNLHLVRVRPATIEVNRATASGEVQQHHLPADPDPTPAVAAPEGTDPYLTGILNGGKPEEVPHLGGILPTEDNEGASAIEGVN